MVKTVGQRWLDEDVGREKANEWRGETVEQITNRMLDMFPQQYWDGLPEGAMTIYLYLNQDKIDEMFSIFEASTEVMKGRRGW